MKIIIDDNWYIDRNEYTYDLKEIKVTEAWGKHQGGKEKIVDHGYHSTLHNALHRMIELKLAVQDVTMPLSKYAMAYAEEVDRLKDILEENGVKL